MRKYTLDIVATILICALIVAFFGAYMLQIANVEELHPVKNILSLDPLGDTLVYDIR